MNSNCAHLLCVLLWPTSCMASEIDRFLESSTVAAARVDLTQVDLSATLKLVQTEVPNLVPAQTMNGVQVIAGGFLQSLRGAGVKRIYATLSMLEITQGHFAIIVPCENPAAVREPADAILALLPAKLGYKTHVSEGAVIVATDIIWQRLSMLPNADRQPLSTALDQCANHSIGVAINVREDLRSAVAAVFPESLPQGAPFEFSPKKIMQDVVSLQLAIQTPPNIQVKLTANCGDAQGALQIARLANQNLARVGISNLKCVNEESQVIVSAVGDELVALVKSATTSANLSQAAMQQSNNLKQIMLAVHNFHAIHKSLPPRMTISEEGKPLLSWRVFLLPYLDQQELYEEFHLDEPWDSPHNLKLIDRIPAAYQSRQFSNIPRGETLIQAPLFSGSAWDGSENKMLAFEEIVDGTSNTICFVMAPQNKSVIWTKPEDLKLRADTLVDDLFGEQESKYFAFFDSSIRTIERSTDEARLKSMVTFSGD